MASLVLSGDTSGSITVSAPAVAGSNTQTLAAVSGTLAPIVSGTAVSASGTSVDFTGIPSWVKRITVMFQGVSTSGTSIVQIQVGSGSFSTSGYLGSGGDIIGAAASTFTSGFGTQTAGNASHVRHGSVRIQNVNSNTWVAEGILANSSVGQIWCTGGSISLSGTLDRIRITTVNGTDTFDAGTINILYE